MRKNKVKEKELDVLEKKISDTDPDNNLFCYLRVSSKEQNDNNHSIDRQKTFGKRIAKQLGKNYIEMNEGGTSSVDRKDDTQFKLLQRLITEGKVKHLWYYSRSRWTRTVEEDVVIKRTLFKRFKVNVYEGESGKLRGMSEPIENTMDNIITNFQELDKETRRQISISGKKHISTKLGQKEFLHMGGAPAFGYKTVDRRLVPHPENSKHLKKIYEMYAQGKSTKDIKFYLETNGVKTSRGNSKWNLRSIEVILGNQSGRYTGYWTWIDDETQEKFNMISPRLVSESLANKVKKRLERNRKHRGDNTRKHNSLFGQKMVCGCGTRYVTQQHKRKSKQGEYFSKSYYCWSKENQWKGNLTPVCNNRRSMEMDLTDKFILNHIEEVVRNSHKFKDDFKKQVLGKKKLITDNLESQKDLIQRRIDRTTNELGLLHESISQINLDKALGKRSSSLCDQMMSDLEKEVIKKEDARSNSVQEIKDLDTMSEWVNWVEQYGEDITNKLSDKMQTKAMVEELIDKITVSEVIGEDREGKNIQIGHKFEILFKMPIVRDKMIYHDENNKSLGYDIKSGRRLLKTDTLMNFTRNGVNRVGYERKKKNKKTQKTQYVEDDNHPVQTNAIGNSGMSSFGQGGYVLSGSVPYLCFTTITQCNDLTYLQEYSVRQTIIYKLIRHLYDNEGMGYRRISAFMNRSGILSERGKKFSNAIVHSILKRKKEREIRISTIRKRKYDFILKDMRIEYFNHS